MAYYRIEWKNSALQELKRINRGDIPRILEAVEALSQEPRPTGVRKLQHTEHTYRLRVGRYRVLYEVEEDRLVVYIVRVRHRRDVYRPG
jgi:mRNA interferase RelE/StbE